MAKFSEKSMIIDGIGAAETVDSSGEILDIKGCDISSLKEGKGVLNWEHQGPPKNDEEKKKNVLDTPKNAIGKVLYAKKIFEASDCDDERQKFFFKKVNEVPYIYIKARLYDGTGHEDAKAAAASFRDAVVHKEASMINFSIEGHTIEKQGNRILFSMARAVAATHKPCNKAAIATVLHDPVTGEKHEVEGKKKDELTELANVDKSEVPGKQILSSVPVDYNCILEDGDEQPLQKTLTAGMAGGAPGTLTGGAALQREDLRKKVVTTFLKNQFLGAVRDYNRFGKQTFRDFLKSRLPEVDDSFIEYFDDMASEFLMRKSEDQRVRRLEFLTLELAKNNAAFKMDDSGFMQPAQPGSTGAQPVVANPPALKPQAPHNLHAGAPPIHLNAAQHGIQELNVEPGQHELVHGLHFNQGDAGHVDLAGHASITRKVKLANGQHGILKKVHDEPGWNTTSAQSPAHAEVLYHNAAKNFFGMGQFVPTTAGIQMQDNPNTEPSYHSVQAAVPGARHLHDAVHEDGSAGVSEQNWNILQNHGQKGDLDKLAMMNAILGNRDRHSGNFMFSGDQMHLIDHGHAFSYNQFSDEPADPGYLSYYHHGITGSPKQADHLDVKIHPEAANWVMGLKPQGLVKFLKGHGASSEVAMHAGARLSNIQRLIQKKGMNTGAWEAYHAGWGPDHLPKLTALLHSKDAVQQAQASRVADPNNATARVQ